MGSWAKEQVTAENIKKNPGIKVYSYMDTENPGIISLVDGYKKGSLTDIESITEYAKRISCELAVITTASPLSKGLVDKLEHEGIAAFGPCKEASKLESNKAYARNLMKKHNIDGLPEFVSFQSKDKAVKYAEEMNWQVAVKPAGLTEGLGVKVAGEQLSGRKEIINYIEEILSDKKGCSSTAVIEEKIQGEEFVIQSFVNDLTVIPVRAVQDFKKLLPGDRGPNTASMGSYSTKNRLLPFLSKEDYEKGVDIIKNTVRAFRKETGKLCRGILYGQFMLTDRGVKLIEYNFRPGDPEWMNTVSVLNQNIAEIITDIMKNKTPVITMQPHATVCKYIVPEGYPQKLYQKLDIEIPEEEIRNSGVDIYYSCGRSDSGRLIPGSERGVAFIAKDETVPLACKKVDSAISKVKGNFFYRKDIGTEKMIRKKSTLKKHYGGKN